MAIYERVPVPGNDNIAFVVRNAYTLEECASLMERAEKEGYTPAEVNGGDHTALILVRDCIHPLASYHGHHINVI